MSISHEYAEPKISAKIKIYVLTRAELLCSLCYEIPCSVICNHGRDVNERLLCPVERQISIYQLYYVLQRANSKNNFCGKIESFLRPTMANYYMVTELRVVVKRQTVTNLVSPLILFAFKSNSRAKLGNQIASGHRRPPVLKGCAPSF